MTESSCRSDQTGSATGRLPWAEQCRNTKDTAPKGDQVKCCSSRCAVSRRTEVTALEYGQFPSFLSKDPEAQDQIKPYYADGQISIAEWTIPRADILGHQMNRSSSGGILRKRVRKARLNALFETDRF